MEAGSAEEHIESFEVTTKSSLRSFVIHDRARKQVKLDKL